MFPGALNANEKKKNLPQAYGGRWRKRIVTIFLRKIAKSGSKYNCTKPTCYQKRRNSIIHGLTLIFIRGLMFGNLTKSASLYSLYPYTARYYTLPGKYLHGPTNNAKASDPGEYYKSNKSVIISNLLRVFYFQNLSLCPFILGQLN